ncbi:hypothetical protein Tco_0528589 [Tanacetum coccineum]
MAPSCYLKPTGQTSRIAPDFEASRAHGFCPSSFNPQLHYGNLISKSCRLMVVQKAWASKRSQAGSAEKKIRYME